MMKLFIKLNEVENVIPTVLQAHDVLFYDYQKGTLKFYRPALDRVGKLMISGSGGLVEEISLSKIFPGLASSISARDTMTLWRFILDLIMLSTGLTNDGEYERIKGKYYAELQDEKEIIKKVRYDNRG